MPIRDPCDRFFYPTLTLMTDSYIVCTYSNVSCLHPVMLGIKEILFEWMSLKYKIDTYCKFRNFQENFVFTNSVKRHTVKPVLSGHSKEDRNCFSRPIIA